MFFKEWGVSPWVVFFEDSGKEHKDKQGPLSRSYITNNLRVVVMCHQITSNVR